MNIRKPGAFLLVVALLVCAPLALAEVYRIVDEDGNVIYTDQAPKDGAQPMDLPGLSVVETPEYQRPRKSDSREEAEGAETASDLRTLRRSYRDFRIVNPMPEQTFWGTENSASVAWDTNYALQEGMSVVFYLDGDPQPPTTERAMSTGRLDRGEHRVRAELYDAQKRRVASTETVTFHVKQHSAQFNRPSASGG